MNIWQPGNVCTCADRQVSGFPGGERGPSDASLSTSRSESQPLSLEIHRRLHRLTKGAARAGNHDSMDCGELTIPHWYRRRASLQTKARQGSLGDECRIPALTIHPSGQRDQAQHRPQPLQGAPVLGFDGASSWSWMTRYFGAVWWLFTV